MNKITFIYSAYCNKICCNNYNKTFTFTGIDQNDKNNNSKVMTENEFIDRVKNLNNTIK